MVDEFAGLDHLVKQSRTWRTARAIAAAIAAAWADSAVRRPLTRAAGRFAMLDCERRVQLAALTLAWAGVFLLAAGAVLPRYVTSGLPWWWTATGIAAASLVAVLTRPMIRAWDESWLADVLFTRTRRK